MSKFKIGVYKLCENIFVSLPSDLSDGYFEINNSGTLVPFAGNQWVNPVF